MSRCADCVDFVPRMSPNGVIDGTCIVRLGTPLPVCGDWFPCENFRKRLAWYVELGRFAIAMVAITGVAFAVRLLLERLYVE